MNGFSRKLGMCIDIMEICFGISNGQISSIFDRVISHNTSVFYFQDNNLSKSQWIFTKFDMCIYIVICFGNAHWQISSIFDRIICWGHDNGGVLSFHIFFCPCICVFISIYGVCVVDIYSSSFLLVSWQGCASNCGIARVS